MLQARKVAELMRNRAAEGCVGEVQVPEARQRADEAWDACSIESVSAQVQVAQVLQLEQRRTDLPGQEVVVVVVR